MEICVNFSDVTLGLVAFKHFLHHMSRRGQLRTNEVEFFNVTRINPVVVEQKRPQTDETNGMENDQVQHQRTHFSFQLLIYFITSDLIQEKEPKRFFVEIHDNFTDRHVKRVVIIRSKSRGLLIRDNKTDQS